MKHTKQRHWKNRQFRSYYTIPDLIEPTFFNNNTRHYTTHTPCRHNTATINVQRILQTNNDGVGRLFKYLPYVRINTYIARTTRDNNAEVLLRRRFEVALFNAAVTRQTISEEYESIMSTNTQ